MSDPASAAKAVVQQVKPTRARRSPEALFDPVQEGGNATEAA